MGHYCLVCGWDINFGRMPSVENEERCLLCCQKFAFVFVDVDNDYPIKPLPQSCGLAGWCFEYYRIDF